MQAVWRTQRRTNPYKNRHALLLQLSFISLLACNMSQTTAGQWDRHKKTYSFYGLISHLVRETTSKVSSHVLGKTEALLSAHTDWLQLCSRIFALNCFFLGALLHHTLQFKPGAPEVILIEISAFSSNQKEEVLKGKLTAYHKSLIRALASWWLLPVISWSCLNW